MIVIKIGGGAGIDLDGVADSVAALRRRGQRLVLVHGGSHLTNELSAALGHEAQFIRAPSGYVSRYTDRRTLEIFEMVYCGQVNKGLVERLQARGVNAIGLSGLDGGLWRGPRKEAIRAQLPDGRQKLIRDSLTGRVERVNVGLLVPLLDEGYTPVLTPPALSDDGMAINVDGDRAAAATAVALAASDLLILSNVPGVLADFPREESLLATVDMTDLPRITQHAAQGRMRIKLLAAEEALTGGVVRVVIGDARIAQGVEKALQGLGTVIERGTAMNNTSHSEIGYLHNINQTQSIKALESKHSSGVYYKRDLTLVRGQGARVWDDEGREYIDCVAGIGVANVGHCHPLVSEAVARQAQRLLTCPELFYNEERARLQAALATVLPRGLERLFLCNSGSEAVEAALKFARLATGRTEVAATMRGFHGRTLGALSATFKRQYRQPFEPLLPGFTHAPFDNIAAMEQVISSDTAAVLVEIVQGEGGVHVGKPDYFQALRRLCDERGALLVVDEVQTGFCRTGTWFACEQMGVTPDLLCMGKAIAGGIPMGAVALGPRVQGVQPGLHGSTFGGNPLACATALAALDVYHREALAARAAELGAYLMQQLQALDAPGVREVRGLGLMVGVELRGRAAPVVNALMARGVLALTAGSTVLRLLPPLMITREELDDVVGALREALHEQAN